MANAYGKSMLRQAAFTHQLGHHSISVNLPFQNRCGKGEVTHYNYTFSPQVGQHSYFLL